MGEMGRIYDNLGLYARADSILQDALIIQRQALDEPHLDIARNLQELSSGEGSSGRIGRLRATGPRSPGNAPLAARRIPPGHRREYGLGGVHPGLSRPSPPCRPRWAKRTTGRRRLCTIWRGSSPKKATTTKPSRSTAGSSRWAVERWGPPPETLTSLNNLARLLQARGSLDEAAASSRLDWGPADAKLRHLAERSDFFDVCRIEPQRLNQL